MLHKSDFMQWIRALKSRKRFLRQIDVNKQTAVTVSVQIYHLSIIPTVTVILAGRAEKETLLRAEQEKRVGMKIWSEERRGRENMSPEETEGERGMVRKAKLSKRRERGRGRGSDTVRGMENQRRRLRIIQCFLGLKRFLWGKRLRKKHLMQGNWPQIHGRSSHSIATSPWQPELVDV